MIERNQLLELLDILNSIKDLQGTSVIESMGQFYRMKLMNNRHQLNEEASGMQCVICNSPAAPEELVLACCSCGSPIHASHLEDFIIARDCPICKTQLFREIISEFQTLKPNFQLSLQKKLNWNRYFSFKTKSTENDGATLRVQQRFTCPICGKPVNRRWNHCKWCGEKVKK